MQEGARPHPSCAPGNGAGVQRGLGSSLSFQDNMNAGVGFRGGGLEGCYNNISDLAVESAMCDFEPESTVVYNIRSPN